MSGRAPTAVDTTVRFLSEAILVGRHLPGDRLTESRLVSRYRVSRSTARAALQVLAAQGLVIAATAQPARVADFSDDDGAALYQIRNTVEPLLIHRFTERASVSQIAAFDHALEVFAETARVSEDVRRVHRARQEFYEVLFDGAASTALEQTVRGVDVRLCVYRRQRLTPDQELARIRFHAATIRRVLPPMVLREGSAASRFSFRMLSEDGAATLRALQPAG